MQIPEFPSLSLISIFPDLRDQFSMFYPCVIFWHLGLHLWFLLGLSFGISPLFFLYSFLCPHSWTMTCSVCPCQTAWSSHSLLLKELQNYHENQPSKGPRPWGPPRLSKRVKPEQIEALSIQTFAVSLTRTAWTEATVTLDDLARSQGVVDLALRGSDARKLPKDKGKGKRKKDDDNE